MPLCKVDYDRSEIREYRADGADAGHKYLHLVLIPKTMNLIERSFMGNAAEYSLNFFPPRLSDGNLDDAFEEALLDGFDKKNLGEVFVDRVEVEIPPTWMTYSSGPKAGQLIEENGAPRVYTSVQITCLFKKKADGDGMEPSIPMNRLKSQAIRMREYRINSGSWFNPTSDSDHDADYANVIEIDDEQPPVQQPIQQPVQQPVQRQQPVRPNRRLKGRAA